VPEKASDKAPEKDREFFERDYRDWLLLMSRDAAHRLAAMQPERQKAVLKAYSDLKNPKAVFHKLLDFERVKRLSGERISSFIVVETEAMVFFPSIYTPLALDFAVAMNRRFFYRGLWFPIIALNREYIRQSSDRVLSFTLEHEFEMNRIYQEISLNLRALSPDEKRDVTDSAQKISAQKLSITQEELIEDDKLMHRLSTTQPLIPKPYAESAMLLYLEDNFSELKSYGLPSISPEEEAFGEELFIEFQSWSEFSQKTYEFFIREISANMREANRGYG
jgi:hypothetical protein